MGSAIRVGQWPGSGSCLPVDHDSNDGAQHDEPQCPNHNDCHRPAGEAPRGRSRYSSCDSSGHRVAVDHAAGAYPRRAAFAHGPAQRNTAVKLTETPAIHVFAAMTPLCPRTSLSLSINLWSAEDPQLEKCHGIESWRVRSARGDAHLPCTVRTHCPPCAQGQGGPRFGGGGGGGASTSAALLSTLQLAPTQGALHLRSGRERGLALGSPRMDQAEYG